MDQVGRKIVECLRLSGGGRASVGVTAPVKCLGQVANGTRRRTDRSHQRDTVSRSSRTLINPLVHNLGQWPTSPKIEAKMMLDLHQDATAVYKPNLKIVDCVVYFAAHDGWDAPRTGVAAYADLHAAQPETSYIRGESRPQLSAQLIVSTAQGARPSSGG